MFLSRTGEGFGIGFAMIVADESVEVVDTSVWQVLVNLGNESLWYVKRNAGSMGAMWWCFKLCGQKDEQIDWVQMSRISWPISK